MFAKYTVDDFVAELTKTVPAFTYSGEVDSSHPGFVDIVDPSVSVLFTSDEGEFIVRLDNEYASLVNVKPNGGEWDTKLVDFSVLSGVIWSVIDRVKSTSKSRAKNAAALAKWGLLGKVEGIESDDEVPTEGYGVRRDGFGKPVLPSLLDAQLADLLGEPHLFFSASTDISIFKRLSDKNPNPFEDYRSNNIGVWSGEREYAAVMDADGARLIAIGDVSGDGIDWERVEADSPEARAFVVAQELLAVEGEIAELADVREFEDVKRKFEEHEGLVAKGQDSIPGKFSGGGVDLYEFAAAIIQRFRPFDSRFTLSSVRDPYHAASLGIVSFMGRVLIFRGTDRYFGVDVYPNGVASLTSFRKADKTDWLPANRTSKLAEVVGRVSQLFIIDEMAKMPLDDPELEKAVHAEATSVSAYPEDVQFENLLTGADIAEWLEIIVNRDEFTTVRVTTSHEASTLTTHTSLSEFVEFEVDGTRYVVGIPVSGAPILVGEKPKDGSGWQKVSDSHWLAKIVKEEGENAWENVVLVEYLNRASAGFENEYGHQNLIDQDEYVQALIKEMDDPTFRLVTIADNNHPIREFFDSYYVGNEARLSFLIFESKKLDYAVSFEPDEVPILVATRKPEKDDWVPMDDSSNLAKKVYRVGSLLWYAGKGVFDIRFHDE